MAVTLHMAACSDMEARMKWVPIRVRNIFDAVETTNQRKNIWSVFIHFATAEGAVMTQRAVGKPT